MVLAAAKSPTENADLSKLEVLFGWGCEQSNGLFVENPKRFKKVTDDVVEILDMIHGVLAVWPKFKKTHSVQKEAKLVIALMRFLLHLKFIYFPKMNYQLHGIKDFKKFAKNFEKAFHVVDNDATTGRWLGQRKHNNKERQRNDAFTKYLASFNDHLRVQTSIDFLMKSFDDEHLTSVWGLDVRDKQRAIDDAYIRQRHDEAGGCECCGRECDGEKLNIVGAHVIPHCDGVEAGGFSSEENGRASCDQCNTDMKTRNFYEYKESGDWKKFLSS